MEWMADSKIRGPFRQNMTFPDLSVVTYFKSLNVHRGGLLLTGPDPLHHLDAAPLAVVDRRQWHRPVEGVTAGWVCVAVALEAAHPAPG